MLGHPESGGQIDPASEFDLCRAAAEGGEEALVEIYRRYGPLVYRFSLRLCRDQSIAEEVTQEVFLALLHPSQRFEPSRAALSTWLCGIARRHVWKQLERRHALVPIAEGCDGHFLESPEDDPDAALSRKEAVAAVREGIDGLPFQSREVIILCELEELSYEQAAFVMGVPVGTVRSRLSRAKARLARLLTALATNAAPVLAAELKGSKEG